MNVNDRMIGDVRVTRVEEMCRPSTRPEDWYIDYNADELASHMHWLAPTYFELSSGRSISSIHSWILRTENRVILIDSCTGNHKDPDQARTTRKQFLEFCAEHHALLLPAHFAHPHGAHIRAAGDEFFSFRRLVTVSNWYSISDIANYRQRATSSH